MNEEVLKRVVREALRQENATPYDESHASETQAKMEPEIIRVGLPKPPEVIKLDGEDSIRLENLLLKQHVEQLIQELEKNRREQTAIVIGNSKEGYQNFLANKYKVNTKTHNLTVDAAAYTLTVVPNDKVEANN